MQFEDAAEIARVHLAAWESAYRCLLPDELIDSRDMSQQIEKWERSLRLLLELADPTTDIPEEAILREGYVSEIEQKIVALTFVGNGRDDRHSNQGEIQSIYVHPDYFRQGIGEVLLQFGEDRLVANGHKDAYLWVLESNARAKAFYKAKGWSLAKSDFEKVAAIDDHKVVEHRFVKKITR